MSDQEFFDLAMKNLAGQASEGESSELNALLDKQPELKAELERLKADVRIAKEVLPLVKALEATEGELPGHARERLRTAVNRTLRPHRAPKDAGGSVAFLLMLRRWRWALGLAVTTVVIFLVALPAFRTQNAPIIQLAVLDTTGGTRGTEKDDAALLEEHWKGNTAKRLSSASELKTWEQGGPQGNRPVARILYDVAAGEVRVSGRAGEKTFQRTFLVDKGLGAALQEVVGFLREQGI